MREAIVGANQFDIVSKKRKNFNSSTANSFAVTRSQIGHTQRLNKELNDTFMGSVLRKSLVIDTTNNNKSALQ